MEDARRVQLERLAEAESSALRLEAATGRSRAALLSRIRAQRDLLMGTAEPVRVKLAPGLSREQRNQAIITAAVQHLDESEAS
ncbi:hypothetical protein ACFYY2_29775 [Streptomyces sp. NPDC001822]|uniref:hypothetical protein n=1 Tax=Streptomyces sp. NPDC001822 TaxID=3364614 RepID=UPI0036C5668B